MVVIIIIAIIMIIIVIIIIIIIIIITTIIQSILSRRNTFLPLPDSPSIKGLICPANRESRVKRRQY